MSVLVPPTQLLTARTYRVPLRAALLPSLLAALAGGCLRQAPGAQRAAPSDVAAEVSELETSQQASSDHFYVKGRHLYDRCGERVILRGVNKMTVWTDREGKDFAEMAKTGANTVRIVWTVKDHTSAEGFEHVINKALEARLIPMVELHDATGDLAKVPELVEFWARPEIVAVLERHEAKVLLNIANEAGGTGVTVEDFLAVYEPAIKRLREVGLRMPLVIDAPRWGQDIDVLQEAGPRLIAADPQRNVLLSVHMWWPKGPNSDDPGATKQILAEVEQSVEMGLPLIIGEFAHAGVGCSRSIDHLTIIATAQRHEIGWLAWSWGPGNKDCDEMDMTEDGRFETLHGWGLEIAVTDPNSIKNTSKIPESMYRGECARVVGQ